MDRLLPFIPTAQPQEAPLSLLRRAAIDNGYRRVLHLLYSLVPLIDHSNGMLGYVARNPALFKHICDSIGIDNSSCEKLSYQRIGTAREDAVIWQNMRIALGDLEFKKEKICIPCYLEKGYTLAEWDHVAAFGCAEHGVLLSKACPVCGQAFTYDLEPLSCGCDRATALSHVHQLPHHSASMLADIVQEQDQDRLQLLTQLCRLIDWWGTLGLNLTDLDKANYLEQLAQGCWPSIERYEHSIHIHSRITLYPLLSARYKSIQNIADKLLATVPEMFPISSLDIDVNRATTQSMLGLSKVRLKKFVSEGLIMETKRSKYPLQEINGLLLKSSWLPFDKEKWKSWQPLGCGQGVLSLAKVIKIEQLQEHANTESGTLNGHLSLTDVDNSHTKRWFTVQEAAQHLKANSESVRRLIKSGLIAATQGTPKSAVQWRIDFSVLDSFTREYLFASEIARLVGLPVTTTSSRLRSKGMIPVSGPGIDNGLTYLFSRSDLQQLDLNKDLLGEYESPAGRKARTNQPAQIDMISSPELAKMLGITSHAVRNIVRDGWIEGKKNSQGHYLFKLQTVLELKNKVRSQYISLEAALDELNQSMNSFRRTWIISGFVEIYQFGKRNMLTVDDYQKIKSIWEIQATSPHIAKCLGRQRSFCLNLEKIGLLQPSLIFGQGAKRTKLFPREHPIYRCYRT